MTTTNKKLEKTLQEKTGIKLDIGCGGNKQPGFVGMDYREMEGVDIVHDVTKFPWPLKDNSVLVSIASHLVEHLPPFPVDSRLSGLVDLLLKKDIISQKEADDYIGEHRPGPIFMRFMDEVWRVTQPDGEFGMVFPYGGSPGFLQDPTHINQMNEATWWYFDPLAEIGGQFINFYQIYKPKPWKIKLNAYRTEGNMEVVLIKRREDPSYDSPQTGQ